LVTLLYFGANLAIHLSLTVDQVATAPIPAVAVARQLIPKFGEPLILSMLMISLAGALNGNILVGPRVLFAVSRDHQFLSFFNRVHPTRQTPVRATLAMCGWAIALITLSQWWRNENEQLFQILTNYCVFGGSIFYLSAVLAIFVLRVRRPNANRPYRAWGYPLVPAVFIAFYLFFLINLGLGRPQESAIGLGFVAIGVLVYLVLANRARNISANDSH
jgi:amino acid transporter